MKVWRFYKKPKNEKTVPIEDIPDAYPLYACTQETKYAKKYKIPFVVIKKHRKSFDLACCNMWLDLKTSVFYVIMYTSILQNWGNIFCKTNREVYSMQDASYIERFIENIIDFFLNKCYICIYHKEVYIWLQVIETHGAFQKW